ncbi:hypothetical protein TTY48_30880 [Tsukamurella sp. TY48]|nr:hypothetical protein TTY48_30880 [Tsukamurella sp. TY48]
MRAAGHTGEASERFTMSVDRHRPASLVAFVVFVDVSVLLVSAADDPAALNDTVVITHAQERHVKLNPEIS